jgi:hypothetical protein
MYGEKAKPERSGKTVKRAKSKEQILLLLLARLSEQLMCDGKVG